MNSRYATISVVELVNHNHVAIEAVSVTPDECALSGAWVLALDDKESLHAVLVGKPVIALSPEHALRESLAPLDLVFIRIDDFLEDAKREAQSALAAFDTFKATEPDKRKNSVRPVFYDWPASIDLKASEAELNNLGKSSQTLGTQGEMRGVIGAARLIAHLAGLWRQDEVARGNRRYIEGEAAERTILPRSWLASF